MQLASAIPVTVEMRTNIGSNFSSVKYVPSTAFTCKGLPSPTPPTSIHKLRPGDITVVAALGDSITAALGASSKSLLDLVTEFRGESWSIGGVGTTKEFMTLPNMLKNFGNTRLTGFSTGTGKATAATAGLNVAISGAIATDMPDQARTLVSKITADASIDLASDWKHVTLWIGGNDLCRACDGAPEHSAETYIKSIEEALDILQVGLPRTFVSLVGIIDVTKLHEVQNFGCASLHNLVCKCSEAADDARASVAKLAETYRTLSATLAASAKYHESDSFTVEYQPFYTKTDTPRLADGKPDRSYFAPDCFHYTEKGHEGAAVGLWNNLLQPPGKKDLDWSFGEPASCPGDAGFGEYLCTSAGNCQ